VTEESEERNQGEIQRLIQRIDEMQAVHDQDLARLQVATQELEHVRAATADSQREYEMIQSELQNNLAQSREEYQRLLGDMENRMQQFEQQRIVLEDERERARLKMEDLQQQIEQLEQDGKAVDVRLQQQKKFYDEERELRRQKEVELMQQRKLYQDTVGTLRQKEQAFAHQRRLQEDELGRSRQKEQVLLRRIEQLQKDWRAAAGRLEQAGKEIAQQRKTLKSKGKKGSAREIDEPESLAFQSNSAAVLKNLEAEAQAELKEWQRREDVKSEPPAREVESIEIPEPAASFDDGAADPGMDSDYGGLSSEDSPRGPSLPTQADRRKGLFKGRPWIHLK
jgi:chromosome segregation ATPase